MYLQAMHLDHTHFLVVVQQAIYLHTLILHTSLILQVYYEMRLADIVIDYQTYTFPLHLSLL